MSRPELFSESIFTWKGLVFSLVCKTSKLKISWHWPRPKQNDNNYNRQRKDSYEDQEVVETSDQERNLDSDDDIFMNNDLLFHHHEPLKPKVSISAAKKNKDLDLDLMLPTEIKNIERNNWSHPTNSLIETDVCSHRHGNGNSSISVVAKGFSFDFDCCVRVPVFLVSRHDKSVQLNKSAPLSSETKEKIVSSKSDIILLGLSEICNPHHADPLVHQLNHGDASCLCESSPKKFFTLIPMRTFSLKDDLMLDILSSPQNIAFISNYGFLHVDAKSSKLQLYFGNVQKAEETQVQQFHCVHRDNTLCRSEILLFKIYNLFEQNSFLLITLHGSVDRGESQSSENSCAAFYFSHGKLLSKKFEMKSIPINSLFPQEFSNIMLSLSIVYFMIHGESCKKFSSSVIIISMTGFAMKFVDGQMTHYIRLEGFSNTKNSLFPSVNIIHFVCKSSDHAAICIDNCCEIVHWSRKEVISTHHNVSFMDKWDVLCTGCPTVLLLLNLTEPGHKLHSDSDVCLTDLTPVIVDGSECESSESDVSDDGQGKSSKTTKTEDREESDEANQEEDNVTKTVLESLTHQERKCRSDFKEMEQGVKNKEIFIENILQMFSSNSLSFQPESELRNLYLQQLVPLFGEFSSSKEERKTFPNQMIKVGQLWKRTVDSLLICGLEIINISKTWQLSDLNLALISMNPSTSSIHYKTRMAVSSPNASFSPGQPDSPVCKRIRLEPGGSEMGRTEKTLSPGKSSILTVYMDTNQVLGGEQVRLKVLLKYNPLCVPRLHPVKEVDQMESICCGDFSVSANDIVSESFTLKPRLLRNNGNDLNNEDVLALDSIQKGYNLEINSTMTSVLSLYSSLKQCPSVGFISCADEFIVTADLPLRYCRMKWLNQSSKYAAWMRVYTRSSQDVIFLVQFLYNLSSQDVTITMLSDSCQPPMSAVKAICQSLIDRVDNSITQMKDKMSLSEQVEKLKDKEEKPKHTEIGASKQEEKVLFVNTDSDRNDIINVEDDDAREDLPKSPTFQSSAHTRGKSVLKSNVFPGTSKTLPLGANGDKKDVQSFKRTSSTMDTSMPMPNVESSSKSKYNKEIVAVRPGSKGKSGKGGTGKGKGKLMMKKS